MAGAPGWTPAFYNGLAAGDMPRVVAPDTRPLLRQALERHDLPTDDLAGDEKRFFAFTHTAPAGFAGAEIHGTDAMLRSVVALSAGNGRAIEAMLEILRGHGIERVYLLTTSAAGFFEKLGFAPVDRSEVQAAITANQQFTGLCPASAACMMRRL